MPTPVKSRQAIYPIKFLISSQNRNIKAGLNLASIGSRQRLMNKAERLEKTVITQKISLYYGNQQFYGFQALHPIFSQNDLGQKQLAGFVVGNYDIQSIIEDVFSDNSHLVDIALYDANSSNQQVLYSFTTWLNSVDKVKQQNRQSWTYSLNVADQQWIMELLPNTDLLSGSESWLPSAGLIIGSLMTLLLTLYLFIALVKTRQVSQLSTVLAGTTNQLDVQIRLKQEADNANLAKSRLLRAASHDLRQLLHTIGLLTTLLKESGDKTEQTLLIDKTQIAVDGMNAMFGSLLDLSLLESGELPVNPQHFYLQDVLEKLVIDFVLQATQLALTFKAVETSACVYTDSLLLERILRNLLSNAIRYTPQGKVLLGCRRLKSHIRICIFDTGIGLDNKAKDKIFDPFYREEASSQKVNKLLRYNSSPPAVIIADYQLFNETGLELALRIRKHYQQQIPVIVITGTSDLKIRQDCFYMIKPIKTEDLNATLSHL